MERAWLFTAISRIGAPVRTPREIVARLGAEIVKILQAPEMRERFLNSGLEPVVMGPDQSAELIKRDIQRYGEIARAGNIRVDS